MSDEQSVSRIKPVMIIEKGTMSREDIEILRQDGMLCVVESDNPESVRFMEPPPMGYGKMEQAAISLFRHVMRRDSGTQWDRSRLVDLYVQYLLQGTPLAPVEPVKKTK